jgi:phage-related protein
MATLTMPLQELQDSAKFTEVKDNPAIELQTDGGYEYTRPRYTSAPKRTWTIGFTNMHQDQKKELDKFWDDVMGGSDAFYWTDPTSEEEVLVRFKSQITWTYKGAGKTIRWDSGSITIKEV